MCWCPVVRKACVVAQTCPSVLCQSLGPEEASLWPWHSREVGARGLTGTLRCKLSQHLGIGLVVGEGEASFSLAPQIWPLAPEPPFVPL